MFPGANEKNDRHMKNNTLFISGSGRSGTNITKAILGQHSQVGTLPFEYRFSVDPQGVLDFYNTFPAAWSPFIASKKCKDFISFLKSLARRDDDLFLKSKEILEKHDNGLELTPYPYHGWELEKVFPGYEKFIETLEENLIEFRYKAVWPGSQPLVENHEMFFCAPKSKRDLQPILTQFFDQCVDAFLAKEEKEIFVEDNTWSILFADDLLELFPQGKILHIVRNPLDVIASMVKQRWTPTEIADATRYYKAIMTHWLSKREKLNSDQLLEIKLEDLTENTEATIHQICQFAGLKFEANLLNVDVSKSNSGRYKTQFSTAQINEIKASLPEILAIYGY